jgi:hypothetical protein
MIGCYDFCGHYEWTFEWLRQRGGEELVQEYWAKAIGGDSQRHAAELILGKGIEGMKEYWGHTLAEEAAGYSSAATENSFRLDIQQCPSKGFLILNNLEQFHDYCDHCIGWIGPVMERAGFVIDHQHNHRGQCWWEMHKASDPSPPSAPGKWAGKNDVRVRPGWQETQTPIDEFVRANTPQQKTKR